MKAVGLVLWLAALSLLCLAGWALFTEEGLWGYPDFRVVGVTTMIAAPLFIAASFFVRKASRQRVR
jgi:hypothetical protein